MSTFTNLLPLLEHCTSLTLILTKQGDKISVVTIPKAIDGAPAGLRDHLALAGTADELDSEFCGAILGISEEFKSVAAQIAEQKQAREEEKQRLAQKSSDKKKLTSKSSANTDDSDDDDDLAPATPTIATAAPTISQASASNEVELF